MNDERLTKADLEILRRPFEVHEHEFYNGYVYVAELAVTLRLEEVDPCYQFMLAEKPLIRNTVGEYTAVAIKGTMIVKGVTRENFGMHKVQANRDKNAEVGEPEKAAATDALRRCARLFGVGAYTLATPDWVKDENGLARWLNGESTPSQQQVQSKGKKQYTHGQVMKANLSGLQIRAQKENPNDDLLIFDVKGQEFKALAFNRDLFLQRGWIGENDWTAHGGYPITQLIPAVITYLGQNGTGYWAISDIDNNPMAKKAAKS